MYNHSVPLRHESLPAESCDGVPSDPLTVPLVYHFYRWQRCLIRYESLSSTCSLVQEILQDVVGFRTIQHQRELFPQSSLHLVSSLSPTEGPRSPLRYPLGY